MVQSRTTGGHFYGASYSRAAGGHSPLVEFRKPRLDLRVRVRARRGQGSPASPVPVERERESEQLWPGGLHRPLRPKAARERERERGIQPRRSARAHAQASKRRTASLAGHLSVCRGPIFSDPGAAAAAAAALQLFLKLCYASLRASFVSAVGRTAWRGSVTPPTRLRLGSPVWGRLLELDQCTVAILCRAPIVPIAPDSSKATPLNPKSHRASILQALQSKNGPRHP